jgi:hypothetical protein
MLSSGHRARFSPQLRTVFAEAVVELSTLLDEVRFSGALAALFIRDYEMTAEAAQKSEPEPDDLPRLGMPIEALALLSPYLAPLPPPITLFQQPHIQLAGNRVLSLSFAGQLIDSALFRAVAALDRLATMLWCSSGIPLPLDHGRVRHPAFRGGDLRTLQSAYMLGEFTRLQELLKHPLFELLLEVRNGFTHASRPLSALHGYYRVGYHTGADMGAKGEIREAMNRQTHLAILLASYVEVLRPAVEATRACLHFAMQRTASPGKESVD